MKVASLKSWALLVLTVSMVSFILSAIQSDGIEGWALLAASVFQGVLIALIVWSERETPGSAWRRLKQKPRAGLLGATFSA
jgi:protein-S-isoprenylcysteine O-methyltransferase Ste14